MKSVRRIALAIIALVVLGMIIIVGPLDLFKHGYYAKTMELTKVDAEDLLGEIDLSEGNYELSFTPLEKHLAGFAILLNGINDNDPGVLSLNIYDKSGRSIESSNIDLCLVSNLEWYMVYTDSKYKKGEEYRLCFELSNSDSSPVLILIDNGYCPKETTEGNIIIGYAYSQSTFSFREKVLISILIIILGLFLASFCFEDKYSLLMRKSAFFSLLIFVMSWNYMYNSLDDNNKEFSSFQSDSEALVNGTIFAGNDDVWLDEEEDGYGLGYYYNLKGKLYSNNMKYESTGEWKDGYSTQRRAIIISKSVYSTEIAKPGYFVEFDNGERLRIEDVLTENGFYILIFEGERVLNPLKYGSLDDATFFDTDGNSLPKSKLEAYKSQYGLQGKIFRKLVLGFEADEAVLNLNLLCAILTAIVFVVLCYLIMKQYGTVLALCFYITFLLSPWVINMARNSYWVEFTWFVPMIAGVISARKDKGLKTELFCYFLTFFSIFVKSMCGYEYISTVMMGVVVFPVAELLLCLYNKDKKRSLKMLKTVIILGVCALLGFALAICIHATIKGDGSIINGIKVIIEKDVLRRTGGGNMNELEPQYWNSVNASVWDTIKKYFHFQTQIITGIDGNLFGILCIVSMIILGLRAKKGRMQEFVWEVSLFVMFFLTTVSWYALAKGHSFVHTHISFVLWYFGFVQICIYIIVNRCIELYKFMCKKD